jgi:hypothetical protein
MQQVAGVTGSLLLLLLCKVAGDQKRNNSLLHCYAAQAVP